MFELLLQRNSKPLICRKIGEEGLTIGRSAENSIVLLDPEISRRHCAIELKGESLRMRDLSKNGTLVNGQMAAEAPLSPGDTLTVGPWTLSVSGSKASASENTLACAPSVTRLVSCDEKKLVVTTEEIEFTVHAADAKPLRRNSSAEEITIGSLASCDIQVEDPFVSRRHCQVTRYGGSTTLVDLGSTNGTFVEGRRVCAAALGSFGCFFAGRTRIDYKIARRTEKLSPSKRTKLGAMIGPSRPMRELFSLIEKVASSDATVCVTGESGTGKELVARELHDGSRRRRGPFVALNCGALPASIIESQLFGHERGAFTGATERMCGLIEQAKGGTLFLDEIGEMPPELQTRLLRVLESRSLRRVGGDAEIPVDVRVVAATNRNLKELVREGRFREDLFFRLYIIHIPVPPLRERREDIRQLAAHFARGAQGGARELTDASLALLEKHSWPGNVRELKNTVERAAVLSEGLCIDAADIAIDSVFVGEESGKDLRSRERSIIAAALEECRGNLSRTSRKLKIARTTLQKKIKRYGIEIPCPDEEPVGGETP